MNFVEVLIQLFDYVIKALTQYRLTEQGAKEWQDIFDAWESAEESAMNPESIVKNNDEPAPSSDEIAAVGRRVVREERVRK